MREQTEKIKEELIEKIKYAVDEETKEKIRKEILEKFKKYVEVTSKEDILLLFYDALTAKESEEEARYDFVYIAEKILNITARYFEFRMSEYTQKGIMFNYNFRMYKRWGGVSLTIDIEFPRDQLASLAMWHEWIKLARRSDNEVKRAILKRIDFLSRVGGRSEEEAEPPKDRLVEEAEDISEKLIKGGRFLASRGSD